jgi:hypothetical protein
MVRQNRRRSKLNRSIFLGLAEAATTPGRRQPLLHEGDRKGAPLLYTKALAKLTERVEYRQSSSGKSPCETPFNQECHSQAKVLYGRLWVQEAVHSTMS